MTDSGVNESSERLSGVVERPNVSEAVEGQGVPAEALQRALSQQEQPHVKPRGWKARF